MSQYSGRHIYKTRARFVDTCFTRISQGGGSLDAREFVKFSLLIRGTFHCRRICVPQLAIRYMADASVQDVLRDLKHASRNREELPASAQTLTLAEKSQVVGVLLMSINVMWYSCNDVRSHLLLDDGFEWAYDVVNRIVDTVPVDSILPDGGTPVSLGKYIRHLSAWAAQFFGGELDYKHLWCESYIRSRLAGSAPPTSEAGYPDYLDIDLNSHTSNKDPGFFCRSCGISGLYTTVKPAHGLRIITSNASKRRNAHSQDAAPRESSAHTQDLEERSSRLSQQTAAGQMSGLETDTSVVCNLEIKSLQEGLRAQELRIYLLDPTVKRQTNDIETLKESLLVVKRSLDEKTKSEADERTRGEGIFKSHADEIQSLRVSVEALKQKPPEKDASAMTTETRDVAVTVAATGINTSATAIILVNMRNDLAKQQVAVESLEKTMTKNLGKVDQRFKINEEGMEHHVKRIEFHLNGLADRVENIESSSGEVVS